MNIYSLINTDDTQNIIYFLCLVAVGEYCGVSQSSSPSSSLRLRKDQLAYAVHNFKALNLL